MLRKLFSRPPQVAITEIEVTAADTASRAGHLRLVDVRQPDEYAAGHPAGAVNVPLTSLPAAIDGLPEGPIAFTCQSGARSLRATRAARTAGRSDVSNVTGGYMAWEKAGLPIETSAGGAA
jgi:rhodanese-related sulfurtransferase